MEYLNFTWIDYTLFSVMLIGSVAIGIYFAFFGNEQKTVTNYFLGGKSMSIFPIAMSMVASTTSSINLLGLPAETYLYGIQFWMMWISWIFTALLTYYIFLPVFYKMQLEFAYEYLEIRFSITVRRIASVLYVFTVITYMPIYVYGPTLAFNQVTGFNIYLIAIILSCLCVFYTSIGGFKAVVWADTFQLLYTVCTLGIIFVMGAASIGGFSTIWERVKFGERDNFFNLDPDPTVRTTFWSVMIGQTATWTCLASINPSAVQRYLAVATFNDCKKLLLIFFICTLLVKSVGCFCGLIVYAKYFDCDPLTMKKIQTADQIIPYFVLDATFRIPGLSGIFISGLLATALSTFSACLNTVSGTIYKDLVSPLLNDTNSEYKANRTMKIIAIVVGILCSALVFVMKHLGTILQIVQSFIGVVNGALLGLFTLGMIFPKANHKGAISGSIVSVIVMLTIVINNQIHIWNGTLTYPTKPLYTHGCNDTSTLLHTQIYREKPMEQPFWLFRVSFLYYGIIGWILTVVVGLLVSCLTNHSESKPISMEVFSPCIHRFLKKETNQTDQKEEVVYVPTCGSLEYNGSQQLATATDIK